ncbi:hypothetical protein Tco_0804140 [Tanacetum coccineum]|uniref:PiggyBac transposable element-derived protein domain-containing protein n=1 Tax=Tanacetum coccineum TaxID=301880 RepID=A0ABQ5A4G3_9ASTR
MLFHQFKMQMQMNKQQQSNQFTTSQPHFEQQSHHLVDETEEEEEEPLPTPTSKPNRGRKKSVAKRNKGKDVEVEKEIKEGRIRHAWTQADELLLAESFLQISEDPKTGFEKTSFMDYLGKYAKPRCFKNVILEHSDSWTMDVSANTIANCFRHCKLRSTDNMTFENSDEGGESTQELQFLIKTLGLIAMQ